jgi:hypothetical protein
VSLFQPQQASPKACSGTVLSKVESRWPVDTTSKGWPTYPKVCRHRKPRWRASPLAMMRVCELSCLRLRRIRSFSDAACRCMRAAPGNAQHAHRYSSGAAALRCRMENNDIDVRQCAASTSPLLRVQHSNSACTRVRMAPVERTCCAHKSGITQCAQQAPLHIHLRAQSRHNVDTVELKARTTQPVPIAAAAYFNLVQSALHRDLMAECRRQASYGLTSAFCSSTRCLQDTEHPF